MKQAITEYQVAHLSQKGLDNLHKFCNEHNYYTERRGYRTPVLTIGQMIEYLGQKEADATLVKQAPTMNALEVAYGYLINTGDMCDKLWEATMKKLEA